MGQLNNAALQRQQKPVVFQFKPEMYDTSSYMLYKFCSVVELINEYTCTRPHTRICLQLTKVFLQAKLSQLWMFIAFLLVATASILGVDIDNGLCPWTA